MEPSYDFTDRCWYKPDGQIQTVKMRRQHSSPPILSAASYTSSSESKPTFSPTTTIASSVSEDSGKRRRVRIQMPTTIMPISSANIEALEMKTTSEGKARRRVPPPPPPSRTHSSQSSSSMEKYGFVPVLSSDFSAFTDITATLSDYDNTQLYGSMEEINLLPKLPSSTATCKAHVAQPVRGGFKSKKSKPKSRSKSSSTSSSDGVFVGHGHGISGSVGKRGEKEEEEEGGRAALYVDEVDHDGSWYRPRHAGSSSSSAARGAKFLKTSRRDVGAEGRITLKRWYFALLKKLFNF